MVVKIYTDGACSYNPGPGGWGAVILFNNKKVQISGYRENTTNNAMELLAAIEGLFAAIRIKADKIIIFSDSAYVVNAVSRKWLLRWSTNNWLTLEGKEIKNKELWQQLLELLRHCKSNSIKVKFVKVKGHSGNKYNEEADDLARSEISKGE